MLNDPHPHSIHSPTSSSVEKVNPGSFTKQAHALFLLVMDLLTGGCVIFLPLSMALTASSSAVFTAFQAVILLPFVLQNVAEDSEGRNLPKPLLYYFLCEREDKRLLGQIKVAIHLFFPS